MTIKFLEEIVEGSFGLWISALFSAVGARNPDLTFSQQKDTFFTVVEYLLTTGRIKFIAPDADCYISPDNLHPKLSINDSESHWVLSPRQIVSYLESKWPEGVGSEDDEALTIYFYEIPAVIWVDEKGCFFSS